MELGAVFFLFSLFIVVALFVAWPFSRRKLHYAGDDLEHASLLTERERILDAIQELDFDQSLGKVPAEEYPARRAELIQKGVAILRQLDALATATLSGEIPSKRTDGTGSKKEIGPAAMPAFLSDEDLEDLIAKRRAARKAKAAGFCPKCGKPALQSDSFCPSCGEALK